MAAGSERLIVLFSSLPDRVLALSPEAIDALAALDLAPPRSANWLGYVSRGGLFVFPMRTPRASA